MSFLKKMEQFQLETEITNSKKRILKNSTKNKWADRLRDEINKGALTTKGKAFSFVLDIGIKTTTYDHRKKYHESVTPEDIVLFREAVRQIPNGLSVTEEYTCLKDERGDKNHYLADVVMGYRISCMVDQALSYSVYNKFAVIGEPFKDKLLQNHTALLKELKYRKNRYSGSWSTVIPDTTDTSELHKNRFCVLFDGIEPQYSDTKSYFHEFEMSSLENIGQCYGMALALIEVHKPEWKQDGTLHISISANSDSSGINVAYWVTDRKKPQLNKW